MADLRAAMLDAGLRDPRTVLQSGNLVFEAERRGRASLESAIEAAMATACAVETKVIARTAAEWRALVAALPFVDMAQATPALVVAMPLRDVPDAASQAALRAAVTGNEVAHLVGATAYIAYPDGIGRSRVTAALVERHLGTVGTARNWRTVLAIAALIDARASGRGCQPSRSSA